MKPHIIEHQTTAYTVVSHKGQERRFLTKGDALNELAWAMINGKKREFRYSSWHYFQLLHARLVRYLKFIGD